MVPVLPVILPLLMAAFLAGGSKIIPERVSQFIAATCSLATLAIGIWLLRASAVQPIVYWFGNWRPRNGLALGVSFAIDPMGAGLAAFTAFLTLAALIFLYDYFQDAGCQCHVLVLVFLGAMSGFCYSGDMFNLFVFFELMSAAAFALCAYKTDDPSSLQGSMNFAVTNTIAAYFVLTGIGVLYSRTGALNLAQMGRTLVSARLDPLVSIGFMLVTGGYLVKAAIVPFHFWLADAHAVAPAPVCVLFSGAMVEMGVYALARIFWATFQPVLQAQSRGVSILFLTIGVVTAVIGALMCYIQRNLKRLLAFSTVSHVGVMVIGVGLFTPAGLAGTAVYVLGHGMVKGALFMVAGILLNRYKSVDAADLYAKGGGERWLSIVFLVGAIGLAEPPFSGLGAGAGLMHASADTLGFGWLQFITAFAGAVTSAAVLQVGCSVFFGWGAPPSSDAPKHEEKPDKDMDGRIAFNMVLPATVLVAGGLLIGLLPNLQASALSAATTFENAGGYAAHVLQGIPFPLPHSGTPTSPQIAISFLPVLAALAIAGANLFSDFARRVFAKAAKPLRFLHLLHSGHIGDYVAFLTLGMAVFGLICAFCFK